MRSHAVAAAVRGMLRNLLSTVEAYGHVPNGGRLYYLDRSQPPLLTQMVELYVAVRGAQQCSLARCRRACVLQRTGNVSFLAEVLPTLDKEYAFWMSERVAAVPGGVLNAYGARVGMPRPEGYTVDIARFAAQLRAPFRSSTKERASSPTARQM